MEKQTPLYEKHLEANGTIVPFDGYLLPVQYPTGIIAEHLAVRQHAGIFDVSHMGEILLSGKDAEQNLNYLLTNNFTGMPDGSCRYSLMLYPDGGQVDDLIVYRLDESRFFVVLNAANTVKDIDWIAGHLTGECVLTDLSQRTAQIALQGPDSRKIIASLCDETALPKKYYSFTPSMTVAGAVCLVSRTGYTGEFGYELYMAPEDAPKVWDALKAEGAVPCGLGCRDTLRLEAAMPLYGHELGETVNPVGAGLSFAIKAEKTDFIGKEALLTMGEPKRLRVGLKVTGRGIIREHETVWKDGKEVGVTTSGTHCPSLGGAYAMAYLDREFCPTGTEVTVIVRGREVTAEVVPLPFYKRTQV